jgi:hypothetical protein
LRPEKNPEKNGPAAKNTGLKAGHYKMRSPLRPIVMSRKGRKAQESADNTLAEAGFNAWRISGGNPKTPGPFVPLGKQKPPTAEAESKRAGAPGKQKRPDRVGAQFSTKEVYYNFSTLSSKTRRNVRIAVSRSIAGR